MLSREPLAAASTPPRVCNLAPCSPPLPQIIHTAGKEAVLSEKLMCASYGQTLVTGFSEPIQSKDYPDFETFSAEVRRRGRKVWVRSRGVEVGWGHLLLRAQLEQGIPRPRDDVCRGQVERHKGLGQ